jgi:hypothetical protein
MEQIRIDRRQTAARVRRLQLRDEAAAAAAAPLVLAARNGTDVDDDVLARIDAVLAAE